MPIYETDAESGRMNIQLKALALVEQDIQTYGPIQRSDDELVARATYHVTQMQANLPTPEARLADDLTAFSRILVKGYITTYMGLRVAYTGLKEPLQITPRYTTSVNLDDSESELPFTGLAGLQAIIEEEQAARRKSAEEDEESAKGYLMTLVQVTVYDAQEEFLPWAPTRFLCYTLDSDTITGIAEQTDISDEMLRGLGLPIAETFASAQTKSEGEV